MFYNCSGLTSVVIPESVTSIGGYAFEYCRGLTSVVIGNSVTSIGEWAFAYCYGLTSVVIPDSVTSIGDSAFYDCRELASVVIGNSVTSIGKNAFSYCNKLVEVINYSSLNIIKGSSNYGDIGYNALNVKTSGTTDIVNKDGYLFYTYDNTNYLLGYVDIGNKTKLVLPDRYYGQTYEIYQYAFYDCRSLTSVVVPNSVTSIGSQAFDCCYKLVEVINLSSLNITKGTPDSYGYIGYYALNVKTSGTSDIVNKDGYLFYTYDNTNYLLGYSGTDTNLVLPDSYSGQTYEIYKYAFCYSDCLTSVVIGNGVTTIGDHAFSDCYGLTRVYYNGTATEWNNINIIGSYNSYLTDSKRYYYSESKPTDSGNYWHYDSNGNVVEW